MYLLIQVEIAFFKVPDSSEWQPNASTAIFLGVPLLAAVHPDNEECASDHNREVQRLTDNDHGHSPHTKHRRR